LPAEEEKAEKYSPLQNVKKTMHFSVTTSEAKKINTEGSFKQVASISIKFIENKDFRYSVVVSKKQGGAAERNRIKRIIREMLRTGKKHYPSGLYLIYYNGKCADFDRDGTANDIKNVMKKILPANHVNNTNEKQE